MRTPFLGPFSVSRSRNLADNQLINLYPELVESRDGKAIGGFYATPGLKGLDTVGPGPIRGLWIANGELIGVSGHTVFGLNGDGTHKTLGTIGTSYGPVSIIDNGKEVAIFDGEKGYVVKGGVGSGGTKAVTTCDCSTPSTTPKLWVVGECCELSAFNLTDNGNVAPQISIFGDNTTLTGPLGNDHSLTYAVDFDSKGNQYVFQELTKVLSPYSSQCSIAIFAAGANGNVAPSATIIGSNTGFNALTSQLSNAGICLDSSDNIYVGYSTKIVKFNAGDSGNIGPTSLVSDSTLGRITSLCFDADRDWIWVSATTASNNGCIRAYDLSGTQKRSLTGTTTLIGQPDQVAIDSSGQIWAANQFLSDLYVLGFASDADGNVAPTTKITGANTGLDLPRGIAIGSDGTIFEADGGANSGLSCFVQAFASGASGNVFNIRKISGSRTHLGILPDGSSTSPACIKIH